MERGTRAIILRNRKILLGRRLKKNSFYDQWCTFGGFLKHDETPKQALRRELREDLGIEIVNPELITVVADVLPETEGKLQQYFFLVKRWEGGITNKSEHLETKWFSKNEFKVLSIGRVGRRVIEKHLRELL